ncbi:MarR family transcriptional regulator [Frankia sp. CcI49]|uniref:MarR family winged helix-turn-helix transcriptional regulator n=1 Tax=unclassified Frankia TaxID=2632575 RepID=UPI0006CA303F|nr:MULTISPECIES: MarR family transcriptional regulator [unclassified Frankia]KPM53595.1 MarR family transcriptional regulator [Frankia sp. R43]ONH52052.1 MarR family transcriptional regulator [Frankia sp. CcI49]
MDGFELFQLGRRLMKLGEQAMPEIGFRQMSAPTRAVVFDIFENPGTSISDIAARVRFPQSQVSVCVARLRDEGAVETAADPRDRRRTLVHLTASTLERAQARPPAEIDAAVAAAIDSADPADVERVKVALQALADLLAPRAEEGEGPDGPIRE